MLARPVCFRLLTPGLLVLASLLAEPATTRAAIIIEVASLSNNAGSTGSFDVLLRNDGLNSVRISSDTVQLALIGASGVQFTAATINTNAANPYIYQQSSTTFGTGSPLSFDSFPTTSFLASDSEFGSLGYRQVAAGAIFGLVRVDYTVAASAAPGVRSFAFDLTGTSLADDLGNTVDFTTRAGTFTINPSAAVPEPASIVLLSLAGVGVYWRARRPATRA